MDSVIQTAKSVVQWVTKQIYYKIDLDKNLRDLKRKRDRLTGRETDLKNKIKRAKLEQMVPRSEVNNWLKEATAIKHQVCLMEKEKEENMKHRILLKYYAQRNLGKRVLETIFQMDKLHDDGKFEDGVTVPLPTIARTLPTSSLIGRTAKKAKNQILNLIRSKKVGIIGVHGMAGLGKTTIMKNVNNCLKHENLFNFIFWVNVSQDISLKMETRDISLKKLQMDIAKGIAKELESILLEEEMDERATALHEALIRRQRFLIILDGIWEPFTLEEIGIPEPSHENGCKIVLTTREFKVCQGMKAEETLEVRCLRDDEAWTLFEDKVGRDALLAPNVQELAMDVVKECGGVPLVLTTVGAALRTIKDLDEWKYKLLQLRCSAFQMTEMQGKVFAQLKFSYDCLSNKKLRDCFLYCSLYPRDYEICVDDLIKYWIWQGLIDEESNMDDQIREGRVIVNGLIRACMLQNATEKEPAEYVKLHGLLRDMAIGITKKNLHFIVKAGTDLEEPLKDDEWMGNVKRVSLWGNRINNLTVIPNWPELTTLFLQDNYLLSHISPHFFQHMYALTVLDLSSTSIRYLPDSLSELVNLRALTLHACNNLLEIPSLAMLKELRALDLSYTTIIQLPLGMEGLGNLRFLCLSHTRILQTVPPSTMSKLIRLQTLEMMSCSYPPQECCSLLDEISTLSRLTHLSLDIPDLMIFSHYVKSGHSKNLRKFTFTVGAGHINQFAKLFLSSHGKCSVHIKGSQDSAEENSFLLPQNTLELRLDKWGHLSLFSLLSRSNARGLKSCEIAYCNAVECIWSEENDSSFLNALEKLDLLSLERLKVVFQGVAQYGIFQSLKFIYASKCPNMKYLFSTGMLKNLQNLEKVCVSSCDGMVELVSLNEGETTMVPSRTLDNTIILPKLKSIELNKVHNLERLCSKILVCNSMDFIKIKDCHKLKNISLSINVSPVRLEGCIVGERTWWEALEWDDLTAKKLFAHLLQENDSLEELVKKVVENCMDEIF